MNIKYSIKRIFGRAEYTEVIADKSGSMDIPGGYAGGSLAARNILLVTDSELPAEAVEAVLGREKACYSVLSPDGLMGGDDIKGAADGLTGPFTHVINLFFDTEDGSFLTDGNRYNDGDSVYRLYQWLQEEVAYLVGLKQYATVCTVFVGDSSIEGKVRKKNVEMCIKGLAETLADHGIICNGVIAGCDIGTEDLLATSVFLSSRYGQVLSGEVLVSD